MNSIKYFMFFFCLFWWISDYIRTFTWDKRLETFVKSSGILGGQGKMPTVVSPELYRARFCDAMHRYFLGVPDQWTGLGVDHSIKVTASRTSRTLFSFLFFFTLKTPRWNRAILFMTRMSVGFRSFLFWPFHGFFLFSGRALQKTLDDNPRRFRPECGSEHPSE